MRHAERVGGWAGGLVGRWADGRVRGRVGGRAEGRARGGRRRQDAGSIRVILSTREDRASFGCCYVPRMASVRNCHGKQTRVMGHNLAKPLRYAVGACARTSRTVPYRNSAPFAADQQCEREEDVEATRCSSAHRSFPCFLAD